MPGGSRDSLVEIAVRGHEYLAARQFDMANGKAATARDFEDSTQAFERALAAYVDLVRPLAPPSVLRSVAGDPAVELIADIIGAVMECSRVEKLGNSGIDLPQTAYDSAAASMTAALAAYVDLVRPLPALRLTEIGRKEAEAFRKRLGFTSAPRTRRKRSR